MDRAPTNGVVVITTKKGKAGAAAVQRDGAHGLAASNAFARLAHFQSYAAVAAVPQHLGARGFDRQGELHADLRVV